MSAAAGAPARRDDSWRVRVFGADGSPLGAGILLPHNLVLTCAHVVSTALQVSPPDQNPPLAALRVDFPGSSLGGDYTARVIVDGWFPADPYDGRGDLAILSITGTLPSDVQPAEIRTWRDTAPATIAVFGHPRPLDDGIWATARPVGSGGPRAEWVQIDGITVPGHRVEGGFSGAGVIDEETGAVVGLVVAEHHHPTDKVAWMVPIEIVVRYWEPMTEFVFVAKPDADPAAPPGPAPSVRLARNDRQRLAMAVLQLPGIHEAGPRERYFQEILGELGGLDELGLMPSDPYLAVAELVRICAAHPDGGRKLADVLRGYYPDSRQMVELDRLVEVLFPDPLLQPAERRALRPLLVNFPPADIAAAYRDAVGDRGLDTRQNWHDVDGILGKLETLNVPDDGSPPALLTFVDHLAHAGPVGIGIDLHVWLDEAGGRLGFRRADMRQLCLGSVVRQIESRRYYLLLELRPDAVDLERYLLSVWLQRDNGETTTVLRDDRTRTLAEVVNDLEGLLHAIPDLTRDQLDELTLEFLLPRELLGHPVDQWELRSFPRTLGIRHPVVIRSLDRVRDRTSHPQWRRKWQWLAEHGHHHHGEAIYWHPQTPDRSAEALYAELVRFEHQVCLVVPFDPDEFTDPNHDPFAAALSAGIPVILWCRDAAVGQRFITAMRSLMTGRGLRELPALVLQARQEARMTGSDRHLGRQLGLLWDDANRFPGTVSRPIKFRAPG